MALKALNVKNGDKIIIPNYTCVSNISAVSQCGAIPIIVEIEKDTLGLDFQEVKRAIKIHKPKVLQLVHVYGFPARDTSKIINLCKKNKIKVIENSMNLLVQKLEINSLVLLEILEFFNTIRKNDWSRRRWNISDQ